MNIPIVFRWELTSSWKIGAISGLIAGFFGGEEMKEMKGFMLGGGIGMCLIAAYLMVKGYVEYGIVTLIIGVVAIAVSSKKR